MLSRVSNLQRLQMRSLVVGLLVAAAALPLIRRASADAGPVTSQAVRELQAKYQAERASAEKGGSAKKFSPELFKQADTLAKKGESSLAAGQLADAQDAFREARWYLPVLPPDLPEH